MFWGLVLKAGKRYSQSVSKAFHVSHATLDIESSPLADNANVQVWINTVDGNHLLCNLTKKQFQTTLDLAFSEGETIAFFSKGAGSVHLTGFLLPEDDNFGDFNEEASDEEGENAVASPQKTKIDVNAEDEDSDSDDSDFDEEDLAAELAEDDSGEEEEDIDDDADLEEASEDEEVVQPPAKIAKVDKKVKQNGLANGKAPKEVQQPDKKKKKEQQPQKTDPQKSKQKTLAGGVVVEDLRSGKGPEARPNKKVTVFYEGRLKSNNRVFDSTKSGDGFQFGLGRGEDIKGWDIGLNGMRVGGKRRITIPPTAAYGSKGAPPQIPPNSTLVFDVELRGVN